MRCYCFRFRFSLFFCLCSCLSRCLFSVLVFIIVFSLFLSLSSSFLCSCLCHCLFSSLVFVIVFPPVLSLSLVFSFFVIFLSATGPYTRATPSGSLPYHKPMMMPMSTRKRMLPQKTQNQEAKGRRLVIRKRLSIGTAETRKQQGRILCGIRRRVDEFCLNTFRGC